MARTKRRSTKRRAAARRKYDWVYRPDAYRALDPPFIATDLNGSYSGTALLLPADTLTGSVLVDSSKHMATLMKSGAAPPGSTLNILSRAARPDEPGLRMHRVQGHILWNVNPGFWSGSVATLFSVHIGIYEQHPDGRPMVDVEETVWDPLGDQTEAADYANDSRTHQWLYRKYVRASTGVNTGAGTIYVDVPVRGTLKPNEGLFVFVENAGAIGSGFGANLDLNLMFWLRTLVSLP